MATATVTPSVVNIASMSARLLFGSFLLIRSRSKCQHWIVGIPGTKTEYRPSCPLPPYEDMDIVRTGEPSDGIGPFHPMDISQRALLVEGGLDLTKQPGCTLAGMPHTSRLCGVKYRKAASCRSKSSSAER